MQPHHRINHMNVFSLILTTVTLSSLNSVLPEDGVYTEFNAKCQF